MGDLLSNKHNRRSKIRLPMHIYQCTTIDIVFCMLCLGICALVDKTSAMEEAQCRVWENEKLNQKVQSRVAQFLSPWAGRNITFSDLKLATGELRLVAVIDHKVYIESATEAPTHKVAGWFRQLSQVLAWLQDHGVGVPDCMFTMHFAAAPKHTRDSFPAAPSLALASSPDHIEVPFPNPWFLTPQRWEILHNSLLAITKGVSFAHRQPVGFYRGGCRGYPASLSRVELAAMNDSSLDVALIGSCDSDTWDTSPDEARALLNRVKRGRYLPLQEFTHYKYLIHMPGSISGSYSRNLQFVLGLGGVVLKWDSPYFEFYYDWLQEGKHFVTVNATNIVQKIQALNMLPANAEQIALATQDWFKDHLHPTILQQYWWHLISQYATMLDFTPTLSLLDNPCSCRSSNPGFSGPECQSCSMRL